MKPEVSLFAVLNFPRTANFPALILNCMLRLHRLFKMAEETAMKKLKTSSPLVGTHK